MRHQNVLVFDEQFSSSPQYTSAAFYTVLSKFDQMAFHAIVDNPSTVPSATISVSVEHSADGRNFLPKAEVLASPEIAGQPVASAATSQAWGYDNGARPSLEFVRLKIAISPVNLACHVKLYVTSRDQGR